METFYFVDSPFDVWFWLIELWCCKFPSGVLWVTGIIEKVSLVFLSWLMLQFAVEFNSPSICRGIKSDGDVKNMEWDPSWIPIRHGIQFALDSNPPWNRFRRGTKFAVDKNTPQNIIRCRAESTGEPLASRLEYEQHPPRKYFPICRRAKWNHSNEAQGKLRSSEKQFPWIQNANYA